MNEFEQKDYEGARSYANSIKKNADNIMGIFDDIDSTMNSLYGQNWASAGAEEAQARYQEIRRNYEVFYDRVVKMQQHINAVTAANEAADAQASQDIASI